ncbi:MAG: NAD(+) synthase [Proteobacteria bacterium]|nr:NAD(+) synthase [Pseudomonadota bacterium]
MQKISCNYEGMYINIVSETRKYLNENQNLKSLIVGISGGIDSALTCALASEITKGIRGVKLIGTSIPIETNTGEEISRAESIGLNFCCHFELRDLTETYQNLYDNLVASSERKKSREEEEKIRKGNIKTRLRMIYLFDLAQRKKGMVLSTDNYTELLLGFWTLHGDVGNYGFLQYLWKTEVYGLASYLVQKYKTENETPKAEALQACIDAVPTDGLGITNSDFDQIEVTNYDVADLILIDYLNEKDIDVDHPVIKRHIRSAFKRLDPQNISRDTIVGN